MTVDELESAAALLRVPRSVAIAFLDSICTSAAEGLAALGVDTTSLGVPA